VTEPQQNVVLVLLIADSLPGDHVDLGRAAVENLAEANEPEWRQRAVSRSLQAARSRAEQRVQSFIDAGVALIDENGTIEFTIQDVIDRSKQSHRAFYQYFESKDELLLALFEETMRESYEDIRAAVDEATDPLARLRAFTIRFHEWCDPSDAPRKRGAHNRRPVMEFSSHLASSHPDRVRSSAAPISHLALDLVEAAAAAGAIHVSDVRHAATLLLETIMASFHFGRLFRNPRSRVTAEETWAFCLHGLAG
jgi:AcrR family transcriptional regulator